MHRLLILAAIAAVCLAAPAVNNEERGDKLLQRPSPINPDVVSDPKPEDKIIMLDDPKENVKHKRDVDQEHKNQPTSSEGLLAPQYGHEQHTQLQGQQAHVALDSVDQHPRQRRDESPHHAHDDNSDPSDQAINYHPIKQISPTPPPNRQRQLRDTVHASGPSTARVPLTHGESVHVSCLQNGNACARADSAVKPQTLPALDHAVPNEPHHHAKRDIPVPLEPKHPHSEESKEDKSKEGDQVQVEDLSGQIPARHSGEQSSTGAATEASTTVHPVIRHHPVPVAELFARSSI